MEISNQIDKIIDEDSCSVVLSELLEVFQKTQPRLIDTVVILGNLIYSIGAAVGGYAGTGPGIEELEEIYVREPGRIDAALMLNGLTVASWYESLVEQEMKKLKRKEDLQEEE